MTISVLIGGLFLYLFFRNVKTGQYDDTYTPSVRMLFDDELVKEPSTKENTKTDENKSEQKIINQNQ